MTLAGCCMVSGLTSSPSFSSCLGANSAAILRSRAASSDLSCFIKGTVVAVSVSPDTGNRVFSRTGNSAANLCVGSGFCQSFENGV